MKNNVRELLPIGSVVILKEAKKKVMVFGVKQGDKATGKEYDYIGVVYPEGSMGEGTQFFFDHEAIDKVFFKGFDDEERTKFIDKLANYYDNK
ncbi:DUF4176 domain-containing protein [Oribacterium sp. FC2011]|uniref:DUF4176 domain-containing protein n=1 Tax=Oribacterium sp. FC2011 TaxID=1408311 RepID=UPI0004E279EC|nr:DUF4176 domain-containing protein [Oribacterium sp. FC2011]